MISACSNAVESPFPKAEAAAVATNSGGRSRRSKAKEGISSAFLVHLSLGLPGCRDRPTELRVSFWLTLLPDLSQQSPRQPKVCFYTHVPYLPWPAVWTVGSLASEVCSNSEEIRFFLSFHFRSILTGAAGICSDPRSLDWSTRDLPGPSGDPRKVCRVLKSCTDGHLVNRSVLLPHPATPDEGNLRLAGHSNANISCMF